jgi:hypothetical protein
MGVTVRTRLVVRRRGTTRFVVADCGGSAIQVVLGIG